MAQDTTENQDLLDKQKRESQLAIVRCAISDIPDEKQGEKTVLKEKLGTL